MQLEDYLSRDDRIVLPLGSTEQHAYLSLGTDCILAERVSVEAAEPLGVPVLPVLPYGLTPRFAAYPGSPTLRVETFLAVVADLLDSLFGPGLPAHPDRQRPRREHAGALGRGAVGRRHPETRVRYHDWWDSPRVMDVVRAIDPDGSHASWMENFPWTRLPGVELPDEKKPDVVDLDPRSGGVPQARRRRFLRRGVRALRRGHAPHLGGRRRRGARACSRAAGTSRAPGR